MDRNFMDYYLFELRFYAEKSFWFQTDPIEAIFKRNCRIFTSKNFFYNFIISIQYFHNLLLP